MFEKATVEFWSATACRRFVKAARDGQLLYYKATAGRRTPKPDRSLRLTRDQFDKPSFSLPARVVIFLNKFKKIGARSIGTLLALTIALAL